MFFCVEKVCVKKLATKQDFRLLYEQRLQTGKYAFDELANPE